MPDRVFVAVELPSRTRDLVSRCTDAFIASDPSWAGEKPVAPGLLHVTLAFLGPVPHTALDALVGRLAVVAAATPPLELALAHVRCVPSARRAAMLWATLAGDVAGAERLASWIAAVVAAVALLAGLFAVSREREGWAFIGTFVAIGAAVATLFLALFPDVMPSTTNAAYSLTTTNASSTAYTLTIMTWVAAVFTPIVLVYTSWTYWTFRRRIGTHHIPMTSVGTIRTSSERL